MSHKQIGLFFLLALSAIFSGLTLGLLDVFGFIDGRYAMSIALLLGAMILLYISLVSLFLLDLFETNRTYTFILCASILFGITFFLMNLNLLLALLAMMSYFLLLLYVGQSTAERFNLYIKFSPRYIFFPVLKQSVFCLLIILTFLAYGQSKKLVSQNALVSPTLVRTFIKPAVGMVNQQINSQLRSEFGDVLDQMPEAERQKTVSEILKKTVQNMSDKKTRTIYGIPETQVPVYEAEINKDGSVDLNPMIDAMLPSIAAVINAKINQYAFIAPFAVGVLTFLIFQPLIFPLQWIEGIITIALFKILIAIGFVKIQTEQRNVERLSI